MHKYREFRRVNALFEGDLITCVFSRAQLWEKTHLEAPSGIDEFCNTSGNIRKSLINKGRTRKMIFRCWEGLSGYLRALTTVEDALKRAEQREKSGKTQRRPVSYRNLTRVVAFVVILQTLPALAKVHPVPLEKDVDAAKCLECHEDKSKGKAVHSAIATGCLSCHEVRVNKDITRIKLSATTPVKMCLTCHSDKDAAQMKGHVHSPAVRDCLKCHDPHVAQNKNQLLKATSGASKDDNLCLTCHTQGTNVPEKGSRHAALDMGCDTCHTTHKVGEVSKPEFYYHLTKAAPALCLDCHDAKDAALVKTHRGQPFATANCLSCHDPHQSRSPKLMQAFQHPPFAERSCDMCHADAKDGKVVLAQKNVKEICVTCHDEQAKKIETAKVQHPGAASDCTDCHSPHASKRPGLPKTNGVEICLNCHTDQAEQGKKAHTHQPAFEQACATCHEPHGGDNEHLLRAAAPNELCLECHGPDSRPEVKKDEHVVTIFGGKVRLPENYFGKVVKLPVKYGLGHPVDRHPISDWGEKKINCLTCHQPHASAQANLLVKDQVANMTFCRTCHQTFVR